MALVVNDRVKETSTTTGTGTFDLAGAVSGFESFVTGIGNSNTTYYAIVNENGEFEVGLGTVTDADPDTLSRDTIISSSNSDSAVNFGAGTKNVFCTLPASKAVIEDSSSNVTLPADLSVGDDLTVEGGVIEFKSNSGSPAALRMYCEVSNAHYQTLEPQPHSAAATNTLRLPDSGDSGTQDLVAVDISQTLTNKTLTTPVISSISNTGTLTLPTSTDTLVGRATTDTLTNKSIDAGQLTGLVPTARLGTGTASSTTFLAGDQTYKTITADITAVTAGDGLTGGGTTGDVTLNVGAGNLIDVQADQIDVDLSELTTSTSDADGDFFAVVDAANAQKKLTKGNINISGFNNDSGFIDGSSLNASNLDSGTVPNARLDQQLQDVAGLAVTDGNIIVGDGSNFVAESGATARTSLGLGSIATLNTVTLTTNTTGNYVASLTAGALIDVGAAGEGATPSIDVDLSEATDMTEAMVGTDEFIVLDASSQKRKAANEINLSIFNNDLPGDIEGVTAGSGLTGGGTSGTVTLNVGAGALIDVTADAIDVDLSELTTSTSDADGDFFVVVDASNNQKKLTKANINNSGFNNDAGYTTNVGDITGVTAGSGLTGGGASGSVTLNVGAGTGIDVAADTIAVDVSDFMTNGSNNRVLTATGTDAMNAEANLTFDGSTLAVTGALTTTGNTTTDHVLPNATDTYDLGASDNVWRNVYTGDLHLSNEGKEEGNAIDGTKGNWTIQEGAEHLYILNNKSGKKYRFKLEEM